MRKTVSVLLTVFIVSTILSCAAITPAETETELRSGSDTGVSVYIGDAETVEADTVYYAITIVRYLCEDGLAACAYVGSEQLNLYIKCPNASDRFYMGEELYVRFCGADYIAEQNSFENITTNYTVEKFIILEGLPAPEKPIIYLYPETDTVCSVKLGFSGRFACTYPDYKDNGWHDFTAKPDGTLVFPDGKEYYALYWEGTVKMDFDLSAGYCVKGPETADFLSGILPKLGLNAKETNEFIIYWLPRLQNNAYNLISFQNEAYEKSVKLDIEPQPDTVIRVFMAYKPLEREIKIEEQSFLTPSRTGFTAVEWGGCEIK